MSSTTCARLGLLLAALSVLTWSSSVHALPSSSEIGTLKQYGHGKFEARTKFAAGDGILSTFFLWKDGSEMADIFWLEVDIEKAGATCNGYSSNALYGKPQRNHVEKLTTEADLCADYHTHTIEWTPEAIAWLMDGVELRRVTGEDVAAFNDNGPDGMQMRFNLWVGNASFGGILDAATLPVHQFISYAEYSKYTPGAGDNGSNYTLQWRDSFEAGVGRDWLKGSWNSPYNKSTHSPQNVQAQNGVAVLSLTPEGTTGFQGEAPLDPLDLPSFPAAAAPTAPSAGPGVTPAPTAQLPETMNTTPQEDSGGCSVSSPSVPRPGAGWLLGISLLGLTRRRRRH